MNESNIGTYGGGGFGTFTSASFSDGSMTLTLTNDWPTVVSMGVDLVTTQQAIPYFHSPCLMLLPMAVQPLIRRVLLENRFQTISDSKLPH